MGALTVLTLRPASEPDRLAAYDERDDVAATLRVTRDGSMIIYTEVEIRPGAAADDVVTALRDHAQDADAVSVRVNIAQTTLAAALAGYAIVARNMYRPVHSYEAENVPTAGHRDMTAVEYDQWRSEQIADYAENAYLPRLNGDIAEARRLAAASYAELLPDGPLTPDTSLVVLTSSGQRVGTLWVGHHSQRFPFIADELSFIYGIDIDADRQGEGWGKAGLAISDKLCVAAGDPGVGLNVFADNTVANGLYRASGFRVVQQTFDLRRSAAD